MSNPDEVARRRLWFRQYVARTEEAAAEGARGWPRVHRPGAGDRYLCPCCRLPTLGERAAYLICPVCYWEDDGQDDPLADEVWGGPNHGFSLTAARANFAAHLTMYPPGDPRFTRLRGDEGQVEAKRRLVETGAALRARPDGEEAARLWRAFEADLAIVRGRPQP